MNGCPNACNDFTDDDRNIVFTHYWATNHHTQRDFLLKHINVYEVIRRIKSAEARKSLTRDYYLTRNKEKNKVWRRFFMNTLDVIDKLIRYTESYKSDI